MRGRAVRLDGPMASGAASSLNVRGFYSSNGRPSYADSENFGRGPANTRLLGGVSSRAQRLPCGLSQAATGGCRGAHI